MLVGGCEKAFCTNLKKKIKIRHCSYVINKFKLKTSIRDYCLKGDINQFFYVYISEGTFQNIQISFYINLIQIHTFNYILIIKDTTKIISQKQLKEKLYVIKGKIYLKLIDKLKTVNFRIFSNLLP